MPAAGRQPAPKTAFPAPSRTAQLRDNAMRISPADIAEQSWPVGVDTRPTRTAFASRCSTFSKAALARFLGRHRHRCRWTAPTWRLLEGEIGTFRRAHMKALSSFGEYRPSECAGDCQVVAGDATSIAARQAARNPMFDTWSGSGFTAAQGCQSRRPVHGALVIVETDKSNSRRGGCRGIRHDRSGEPPLRPREPAFSGISPDGASTLQQLFDIGQ